MIRVLKPWFENISKRQVKSPKIYFRDTGILHSFLGITNSNLLYNNAKIGASFEGFALEEVIRYHQVDSDNCYFWASHSIAEIDLMITQNGKRLGFEFKYSSSPKITKSMQIAIEDIKLNELTIVIPGKENYKLAENIKVMGLLNLQ